MDWYSHAASAAESFSYFAWLAAHKTTPDLTSGRAREALSANDIHPHRAGHLGVGRRFEGFHHLPVRRFPRM